MEKCATKGCGNEAYRGGLCHTCRSRKYARESPFKYHYNALRNNARRRGKKFDLTFEEFKEIWLEHPEKWAEKKRPGVECKWQMDRKKPWLGYTKDNIQIIEKSKNVIKYQKHGRFQMEVYWAEKNGQLQLAPEDEAPF